MPWAHRKWAGLYSIGKMTNTRSQSDKSAEDSSRDSVSIPARIIIAGHCYKLELGLSLYPTRRGLYFHMRKKNTLKYRIC